MLFLFGNLNLFSQIQIGNDIDGEAADDHFGTSVSLSSDGSLVAIGAPVNNGNGLYSGHVRVYETGIPPATAVPLSTLIGMGLIGLVGYLRSKKRRK